MENLNAGKINSILSELASNDCSMALDNEKNAVLSKLALMEKLDKYNINELTYVLERLKIEFARNSSPKFRLFVTNIFLIFPLWVMWLLLAQDPVVGVFVKILVVVFGVVMFGMLIAILFIKPCEKHKVIIRLMENVINRKQQNSNFILKSARPFSEQFATNHTN